METSTFNFSYFVKGDISGIQDFIFNVKSERAAKTLKARSVFVQALADVCLHRIEEALTAQKAAFQVFYNGGGNFFLFTSIDPDGLLREVQQAIDVDFLQEGLHLSLAAVPVEYRAADIHFQKTWKALEKASQEAKMRRFAQSFAGFEAFEKPALPAWDVFTSTLVRRAGYVIQKNNAQEERVQENHLHLLGYNWQLTDKNSAFADTLTRAVPRWTRALDTRYKPDINAYQQEKTARGQELEKRELDSVIPFEYLAVFAKARTGTDKLGILKMDVDGLGEFFRTQQDQAEAAGFSEKLSRFFSRDLHGLLHEGRFSTTQVQKDENGEPLIEKKVETDSEKRERKEFTLNVVQQEDTVFSDHIYTVFAGGDDCFFIGGWDAILQLALKIQEKFARTFSDTALTISAGVVVVDNKFPVVQFAKLADEALESAKRHGDGQANKINIFGENLTWTEYREARKWSLELEKLIKRYREPRALLYRLKKAQTGYERLVRYAGDKRSIRAPKVWRLAWYLRDKGGKRPQETEKLMTDIMTYCENALLGIIMREKGANPAIFGVAARWAEFLTKN
jgi:CRISPR-associated protein Csm1